jgi:hypothetical protein
MCPPPTTSLCSRDVGCQSVRSGLRARASLAASAIEFFLGCDTDFLLRSGGMLATTNSSNPRTFAGGRWIRTLTPRAALHAAVSGRLLCCQIWQQKHSARRLDRIHFGHRSAATAGRLVTRCRHLRGDEGTNTRSRSRASSYSRQHRLSRRCANATVVKHGKSRPSRTVSTDNRKIAGWPRWRYDGDRGSLSLPYEANLRHGSGTCRGRPCGFGLNRRRQRQ